MNAVFDKLNQYSYQSISKKSACINYEEAIPSPSILNPSCPMKLSLTKSLYT